jgi:hypothetical protein
MALFVFVSKEAVTSWVHKDWQASCLRIRKRDDGILHMDVHTGGFPFLSYCTPTKKHQ